MAAELRTTVINMKTLNQDIEEPIVVGEGDMEGRRLRVIFTQEAAAQFTPNTKIYLCWKHQELDIRGYNVFTEIKKPDNKKFPPTWEITYPKSMLHEGHVLANIQLVDNVSIATSTNILIHVLINPDDGSEFIESSDYSEFQKAVITLTNLADDVEAQMAEYENEFEEMQLTLQQIQATATNAEEIAQEAKQIAEEALAAASANSDKITTIEDDIADIGADIINITTNIENLADQIQELVDKTGLTEEEALALIEQQLIGYVTIEQAEIDHAALWAALQIQEYGFDEEGD